LLPYEAGLIWQRKLARARIDGDLETDLLLLVEHEPVLTLGRGSDPGSAGIAPAGAPGGAGEIPRYEVERGGDVTYHGPGQLVGYPILDLGGYRRDLHWYLRTVEESLILALGDLGAPAFRVRDHTGVWVGDRGDSDAAISQRIAAGELRKIASIGVHVSHWVTWHGFALNVQETALGPFAAIVPCGIPGVNMTCLETEGCAATWDESVAAVIRGFGRAFGAQMEPVELAELKSGGLGPGATPAGLPGNAL
jgi:lipoyl(octanoyl) transferase